MDWLQEASARLANLLSDSPSPAPSRQNSASATSTPAKPGASGNSQPAVPFTPVSSSDPPTSPSKYCVTPSVIEFVNALCDHESTFINFPRSPEDEEFILTDYQCHHAKELLKQSEPLAKLRYKLCPIKLSDNEFWRVYFILLRQIARRARVRAEMDEEDGQTNHDSGSSEDSLSCRCSYHRAVAAGDFSVAETACPRYMRVEYQNDIDFDQIDRLCVAGGPAAAPRETSADSDDEDYEATKKSIQQKELEKSIISPESAVATTRSSIIHKSGGKSPYSRASVDLGSSFDLDGSGGAEDGEEGLDQALEQEMERILELEQEHEQDEQKKGEVEEDGDSENLP